MNIRAELYRIKDGKPRTFSGGGDFDRTATRLGLAEIEPCDQIQPKMVVDLGQITVFEGDNLSSHFWSDCRTRCQLDKSSSSVFPPQYKSSANSATMPSCMQSPRTRHTSSSMAVSEPGIHMAQRV